MTTMNTAGRLGKAWGIKAQRSYLPVYGWTDDGALGKARHHAARELMRSFMELPQGTPVWVADHRLRCLEREEYEQYAYLFSRLDRELVKAYFGDQ